MSILLDSVFVFNFLKAGWMVSVDAAIFMVAVIMLVRPEKRLLVVVFITLAHTFYGYLGLAVLSAEKIFLEGGLPLIIAGTSFIGLRFIIEGLDEDDEGEPADDAHKINLGVLSLSAIALYSAVSIDELFAVLQRYQWMEAQGWNDVTKALNIGASMLVLFILLLTVKWTLEREISLNWIEENGDKAMFIVFSLIMYYIVRGIVQNGMEYEPIEIWFVTEHTGLAPELLVLGFILTIVLKKALEKQSISNVLNKIFLLKV